MSTTSEDLDLINRFLSSRLPELREEMILRHVPLVHFVVGRMGVSREIGSDYEDMVSQGLIGLMDAVDRFDPSFGTQFSSYAVLRIRGKVLDYLRSMDWLTRDARRRTRSVQQAVTELWSKLHREPTDDEIATHLAMDVEKVQQALVDCSRVIVSMDAMLESDQDEGESFHETLADHKQEDPEDLLGEDDLRNRLAEAIRSLSQREQLVLSLYYYEELTFKEIGSVLEVSESRVCQLHSRAVMSIRRLMHDDDDASDAQSLPGLSALKKPAANRSNRVGR